jgi:cyclopropane-fatty-acyl-phospholipid synthase
MLSHATKTHDPAVDASIAFLNQILQDCHPRSFAVRLWDDTLIPAEDGQPTRFTLVLKHRGSLRRLFWPPRELTISEAYVYGDFDIEGEIEAVLPLAESILGAMRIGLVGKARLAKALLSLPNEGTAHDGRRAALRGSRHSIERDKLAVTYHYDVSNDFYALWQDSRMLYSCALFANPDEGIETAQTRKLEYICRKLRLEPGDRLLDIGCGWGGLVTYAAQHFGVNAVGITLSQPQADLANQRIREAGLAQSCRIEVRDYREVPLDAGFDKIVSVGMFEHVGAALLPEYMRRAYGMLKHGGVFLNHGIAVRAGQNDVGMEFSQAYVFPDGELVPISQALTAAEEAGFEVRDVEGLREHYALTLRHWVSRLEARHEEAVRAADEITYRVWRLYMAGSAHQFAKGFMNVYQSLLAKPRDGASGLPLLRSDWYAPGL